MEKLLYVDCCIRRDESRTKLLADYFLDGLRRSGKYEIQTLCLMDEPLCCMSEGFFRQRDELLERGELDHPRFCYARQFAAADKIIIAAPFWDLSIPALLKIYIENICVHGISFVYDKKLGLTGICRADRLLFITTRGTFYENTDMELGSEYLQQMSRFWGIKRYDCLFAEGLDARVRPVEEILSEAREKADRLLESF